MNRLTDEQLIDELKERFRENNDALYSLSMLTKKLEEMNRKLQESEALKSNFLSNIRNEMNNPLASILGFSRQLLSEDSMPEDAVRQIAGLIYSEAFSLDYQLRNIFAAAELEAGEVSLNASAVDVNALVQNVIRQFGPKASEKNISIIFDLISSESGEQVIFRTDSEKLQLIVSNLLGNAIEFSPEGKSVEVKVWIERGYLNLSVEDDGIGIEQERQKMIFDRFRQLDYGSHKRHRGHGLGLSITRDLIGLMLGNIVVSSASGKGSTFKVTAVPELESQDDVEVFSIDGNVFLFEENSPDDNSGV